MSEKATPTKTSQPSTSTELPESDVPPFDKREMLRMFSRMSGKSESEFGLHKGKGNN